MWDLSGPGIEPVSLALADRFFIPESPGKPGEWFLNWGLQGIRETLDWPKCCTEAQTGIFRGRRGLITSFLKILRTWITPYFLCQIHYVDPMAGICNEGVNCCLSSHLAFPSVQYVSLRWTGPPGASKSQGVWREGTGKISALWQFSASFMFLQSYVNWFPRFKLTRA